MIMGLRPSLGFLGYAALGGSMYRMSAILFVFVVLTLAILIEVQHTTNFHFFMAAPFPPPVFVIPDPDMGYMTPLDACSVEAATVDEKPSIDDVIMDMDDIPHALPILSRANKPRAVHVYLWSNTITSRDKWGYLMTKLPNVHVGYMDVPKLIEKTPLDSWYGLGGITSVPGWKVWATTSAALLWSSGGISIPMGVVMTKPYVVHNKGSQCGLMVIDDESVIPVVLSTPKKHPILSQIFSIFSRGSAGTTAAVGSKHWNDELSKLLIKAVRVGCGEEDLAAIYASDCQNFKFLQNRQVINVDKYQKNLTIPDHMESFFRYTGDRDALWDDDVAFDIFTKYSLSRYCPTVAGIVKKTVHSKRKD